jgi:penicillin-binding protein 1C
MGFRRRRVALSLLAALAVAGGVGLAWPLELPPAVEPVRVLDRNGLLVAERPVPERAPGAWVSSVPELVALATLAAEDHRFRLHPGVDAIAVLRAARANLGAGHPVQGGSTITQQLARNLWPRPPGLRGKLWEAWTALRLELWLTKDEILVEYLNRIYYGSLAYGIDAAARTYLDKSVVALSVSEAALLAALPRRPSHLDPWSDPEGARAARDRVLDRMQQLGWLEADRADEARAQSLGLRDELPWYHAPHFVRRLPRPVGGGDLHTTLDLGLQQQVQRITLRTINGLEDWGVSQAAVLVVDTRTGEVLAYLGSADWSAPAGQVDGVTALRSPGSALKPFAYWLGLERGPSRGGITQATVLPDLPGSWSTSHGTWAPGNYDGRFHGPVTARDALAQSLNLPAVRLTEQLGVADLQRRLQDLGITSLEQRSAHYGLGLVLGDCEVRLEELVGAYATLGRLGARAPLRFLAQASTTSPALQVGDDTAAWLVLQALDDADARAPAFGHDSVLEPGFFMASKTGTSVGWRDNWAVGVTPEVTIGVWVGNFDGRPMREVSGISGAGPILLEVAIAAHRGERPPPDQPPGLEQARICPLSGLRVGSDCPGGRQEYFVEGTVPERACDWHREVPTDGHGALAHGCPEAVQRLVVAWPTAFTDWAAETDQPRWPEEDLSCSPAPESLTRSGSQHGWGGVDPSAALGPEVGITAPADGGVFYLDPRDPAEQQALPLRAAVPVGTRSVRWLVDGQGLVEVPAPFAARWVPSQGQHIIELEIEGVRVSRVEVWIGGGDEPGQP